MARSFGTFVPIPIFPEAFASSKSFRHEETGVVQFFCLYDGVDCFKSPHRHLHTSKNHKIYISITCLFEQFFCDLKSVMYEACCAIGRLEDSERKIIASLAPENPRHLCLPKYPLKGKPYAHPFYQHRSGISNGLSPQSRV